MEKWEKLKEKIKKSLMEKRTLIEKINKGHFSSGEDMLFTHPTFYLYYRSRFARIHRFWAVFVDDVIVYFLLSFLVVFMLLASARTLHLPYLTTYLPTFHYLTSYLTFHYLTLPLTLPYLTLHHILPFITLPCPLLYPTLPYLLPYILPYLALPYLTSYLT